MEKIGSYVVRIFSTNENKYTVKYFVIKMNRSEFFYAEILVKTVYLDKIKLWWIMLIHNLIVNIPLFIHSFIHWYFVKILLLYNVGCLSLFFLVVFLLFDTFKHSFLWFQVIVSFFRILVSFLWQIKQFYPPSVCS